MHRPFEVRLSSWPSPPPLPCPALLQRKQQTRTQQTSTGGSWWRGNTFLNSPSSSPHLHRLLAPATRRHSGVGVDLSTSLVRMIGPRQNSAQVVTTLTHQFSRAFKPLKSHPSHSPSSPPAWQTTSRLDTWPTQILIANTNSTSQTIYATPPWLAKAASLATVSGS